ncbi:Flp pilus assembly protein CpaB [Arthrobacter sp. Hz1]
MKSRIIGATVAVMLAVVGAVLLVSYVNGSEERALAGTETQIVLVVRDGLSVPEGTSAEALRDFVSEKAVPAKVVPPDAVRTLEAIAGQQTTVELVSGEQLLSSRFANPEEISANEAVSLPEGMQEVTILLEPQRVVGGQLAPGDTVGLIVSLEGDAAEERPSMTQLTMHKVLVTTVQGLGETALAETGEDSIATPVPPGSVLVTLARTAPDVEEIVYAQEFGRIWLSKEPASASEEGTRSVTSKELFE